MVQIRKAISDVESGNTIAFASGKVCHVLIEVYDKIAWSTCSSESESALNIETYSCREDCSGIFNHYDHH